MLNQPRYLDLERLAADLGVHSLEKLSWQPTETRLAGVKKVQIDDRGKDWLVWVEAGHGVPLHRHNDEGRRTPVETLHFPDPEVVEPEYPTKPGWMFLKAAHRNNRIFAGYQPDKVSVWGGDYSAVVNLGPRTLIFESYWPTGFPGEGPIRKYDRQPEKVIYAYTPRWMDAQNAALGRETTVRVITQAELATLVGRAKI